MKLKHKIALLVIGVLLVVSLLVGSSYALWFFNVSQESTNVVQSDCFEITYEDGDAIHLTNAFPMEDSLGIQLTPYKFTIRNICNHPADLQINLETLNSSTLDASNIKADLNGHIKAVGDAESVEPTLDNASSAVMLKEDTLDVNESKTYTFKIWIKDDAIQNEIENKTYSSKVTIKATVRKKFDVAMLEKGIDFSTAIYNLAGNSLSNITSIERSLIAPEESDNAILISDSGSSNDIYAWFNNGIVYIYSNADKIYMNEDSSYMFAGLSGLDVLDLSFFDSSKVKNMSNMFLSTKTSTSFDISSLDTSNVEDMSNMFGYLGGVTNLDLSNFNTSNVKTMFKMFYYIRDTTSLNLGSFNTSNVEDMSYMFSQAKKITDLDLSSFDVSNVKTMKHMFEFSEIVNLNASSFGTSEVTDLEGMFYYASELQKVDLSNFKTPKATNMSYMFYTMVDLTSLDIHNFDTSSVVNMYRMFYNLKSLESLDVSSFDTSNVTNMGGMFSLMPKLKTLDLSNFNTSKVTFISNIFNQDVALETIYVGDDWDVSSLSDDMFSLCRSLVGGSGTVYNENYIQSSYAHVDGGPSNPGYLTYRSF